MTNPTLTLVRGAEYGQEIQGLIFPIRIVTSNAETLDQAIEQSHQAERLAFAWNSHDALVEYYKASVALQNTMGHPEATAEDENKAEARFDAATVAARATLTAAGAA